jgi:hypothetical protein
MRLRRARRTQLVNVLPRPREGQAIVPVFGEAVFVGLAPLTVRGFVLVVGGVVAEARTGD